MIFRIESMGPDNHYVVDETFEADTHKAALEFFRTKFPTDPEKNPVMLRDWQSYRVTEDTLAECTAWTSMSRLRLHP